MKKQGVNRGAKKEAKKVTGDAVRGAYTRWTKAALISKINQQADMLNELQNHQALLDGQIRIAERFIDGYQSRAVRMTKRNEELKQDVRNLKAIRFALAESLLLSVQPPTELSDRLVDTAVNQESPG